MIVSAEANAVLESQGLAVIHIRSCAQVLNCTGSDEGCKNTAMSAFDQQKAAVVGSLFQLLLASAGLTAHSMQASCSPV